jgi:hypothetical protein
VRSRRAQRVAIGTSLIAGIVAYAVERFVAAVTR